MRCPQCMNPWNGKACNHCGYEQSLAARLAAALPAGTMLNQRYQLGNALAESRQAIGYIAWDAQNNRAVLLEEFYPKSNATRTDNGQVVSRRNPAMFKQAQEMFGSAGPETGKLIPCIDAFMAGGTAWRVYQPNPDQPVDLQMDALLDRPVFFRDPSQRAFMTVNALPMPELPRKREFQPTARIARKRRNRLIKRIALGVAAALLLLVGAFFLLAMGRPVDVTLQVPLYQGQKASLQGPADQTAVDITQELQLMEGQTPDPTGQSAALYEVKKQLAPGQYKLMIAPEDVRQSPAENSFTVRGLRPMTTQAPGLEPMPQVRMGDKVTQNDKVAIVIQRLKDLGYLDALTDTAAGEAAPDSLDETVWRAYLAFAANNNLPVPKGQEGIYLAGMEALRSDQAIGVPYLKVAADQDPGRAAKLLKRLKDLFYLLEERDSFDQTAFKAYEDFLKESGMELPQENVVSVAGAKALFSPAARKKEPDVVIGEESEMAEELIARLKELGKLKPDEALNHIFDNKVHEAYISYVHDNADLMDLPIEDGESLYLLNVDVLLNAKPTPSPSPNPIPEDGFVYKLGENPPRIARPGEKPAELKNYDASALVPVEIQLDSSFSYAVKGVILTLAKGGAEVTLPVGSTKNVELVYLPGDTAFRVDILIEDDSGQLFQRFVGLGEGFYPSQLMMTSQLMKEVYIRVYKPQADNRAIDDFWAYGAMPIPADSKAWLMNGNLQVDPSLDEEQLACLKTLYSKEQRIQQARESKAASHSVYFNTIQISDSPFLKLLTTDSELSKQLFFSIPPVPGKLVLSQVQGLGLQAGEYTLTLFQADQQADHLMRPAQIAVSQDPTVVELSFNAGAVRELLGVTACQREGVPLILKNENWLYTPALEAALMMPENELVRVSLSGSLPELARPYYASGFTIRDTYGNILSGLNANETLLLQPGQYQLVIDDFESDPLNLEANSEGVFSFPDKARAAMEENARAALAPEWMYTLESNEETPQVMSDQVAPADLKLETMKSIFDKKKDEFLPVNLQFVQQDGQSNPQVTAVRLSVQFPGKEWSAPQDWPLAAKDGHRLNAELYIMPELAIGLGLMIRPAAADGMLLSPSETYIRPSLQPGEEKNDQYAKYALVDFIKAIGKLEKLDERAVYGFFLKEEDPNPVAILDYQGPQSKSWVLLPEGNVLLVTNGKILGTFAIGMNGSAAYTKAPQVKDKPGWQPLQLVERPAETPETPQPEATPTPVPTDPDISDNPSLQPDHPTDEPAETSEAQVETTPPLEDTNIGGNTNLSYMTMTKSMTQADPKLASLLEAAIAVKDKESLKNFYDKLPPIYDLTSESWTGSKPEDVVRIIKDLLKNNQFFAKNPETRRPFLNYINDVEMIMRFK